MKFDEHGHIVWQSPRELFKVAVEAPHRLLIACLMAGTPWAFPDCACHADFLEAIAERTGVHPRNLYLRGSCHIGFSIAPRRDKVWIAMGTDSDLDLVMVDAAYFHRLEDEVRHWEARNPVRWSRDKGAKAAERRAQDRQFNLCRDEGLPPTVCVHHQRVMKKVAALAHCGHVRALNAFIYSDWHSAQQRYEFDLRELREGVDKRRLPPPPASPLPREQPARTGHSAAAPAAAQPANPEPPPVDPKD